MACELRMAFFLEEVDIEGWCQMRLEDEVGEILGDGHFCGVCK